MNNNETLNCTLDKRISLDATIKSNFSMGILKFRCPICKKDCEQGRYIWNVDNGTIAGKIICEDCFKNLFGDN